jgi:hypothetical protein
MAFETGTATGVNDLLQKLSTFLAAQGWTINQDAVSGSGRWLSVQKGAELFLNFLSDPATTGTTDPGPWIHLRGATGYDGGLAFTSQPGVQPGNSSANKLTGAFTAYWFFEGDDYIHIVIEIEAGRFRHLHGGTLDKACTFTGGTYCMGTALFYSSVTASNPETMSNVYPWSSATSSAGRPYNYIRADAGDGVQWHPNGQGETYRHAGMWREINSASGSEPYRVGFLRRLLQVTPSDVNGLAVLERPRALVKKLNNLYALLGAPKDVRLCSIENMAPGGTLTIGSDEWLVFPWSLRSSTIGDVTTDKSGYYALAYRKNLS